MIKIIPRWKFQSSLGDLAGMFLKQPAFLIQSYTANFNRIWSQKMIKYLMITTSRISKKRSKWGSKIYRPTTLEIGNFEPRKKS